MKYQDRTEWESTTPSVNHVTSLSNLQPIDGGPEYTETRVISNPSKQTGPIFVNEALTSRRAEMYGKTRQLVKAKKLNSCWTYDGRIYVKLCGLRGKKMVIDSLEDLDKFEDDEGI